MRALLVALALMAVAASPAAAAMQPAASVTLTDVGVTKDGSHQVRIDWSATCGPDAPNAEIFDGDSFVGLMHVPKRAGARPFAGDGIEPTTLSGSTRAGAR